MILLFGMKKESSKPIDDLKGWCESNLNKIIQPIQSYILAHESLDLIFKAKY